jgi:hypothetical protein
MHFEQGIVMDILPPSVGDLLTVSSRTELIEFYLSRYLLSDTAPPTTRKVVVLGVSGWVRSSR